MGDLTFSSPVRNVIVNPTGAFSIYLIRELDIRISTVALVQHMRYSDYITRPFFYHAQTFEAPKIIWPSIGRPLAVQDCATVTLPLTSSVTSQHTGLCHRRRSRDSRLSTGTINRLKVFFVFCYLRRNVPRRRETPNYSSQGLTQFTVFKLGRKSDFS